MNELKMISMPLRRYCTCAFLLMLIGTSAVATASEIATETETNTAWIDVRSAIEHGIDSIEGDPRVTHGDIVEKVTELYPDKETEIRLYCRSGGRAGKAMSALKEAGYTNVFNAGGIDDARAFRGLSN